MQNLLLLLIFKRLASETEPYRNHTADDQRKEERMSSYILTSLFPARTRLNLNSFIYSRMKTSQMHSPIQYL